MLTEPYNFTEEDLDNNKNNIEDNNIMRGWIMCH